MNVHKNARTCPASRALLVDRVDRLKWTTAAAAAAAGVSERRAREWLVRGRRSESLEDRSSRPHRSPMRSEMTDQVLQLRRERRTLMQIAELTGISCSTVGRICRTHGLNRIRLIDPVPPPPVRRYQRERPGELLHLDTKKLGRFTKVGHRITRSRTFGQGGGWEYVHVAIDDASRVVYAEVLSDERGATAADFFDRAVAWFSQRGVTVEQVMTDNGSAYVSNQFARTCRARGARHIRTRPYTPRTNGKAERMIQTLLREWAYRFAYENSAERRWWLDPYLHFYNIHRRHSAVGYTPPISRLDRNNVLTLDS